MKYRQSVDELFCNKICCEESTPSQYTTQMNSKLKAAIESLDVRNKKQWFSYIRYVPNI